MYCRGQHIQPDRKGGRQNHSLREITLETSMQTINFKELEPQQTVKHLDFGVLTMSNKKGLRECDKKEGGGGDGGEKEIMSAI